MWTPKASVDAYALKTRVLPFVWATAPMLVLGMLAVPRLFTVLETAVGGGIACVAVYLLSQLGRDPGKAIESALFREWGGKPSVAVLRHRDPRVDDQTKRRWRTFLESAVPGLALATEAEERERPTSADHGYESATRWLLTKTGDAGRFRILHAENASYGFRRNTLGLRWYAVAVNAGSTGAGWWLVTYSGSWGAFWSTEGLVYLAVSLVHGIVFLCVVRPAWVKVVADAYARQLLACCDDLAGSVSGTQGG